MTKNEFYKALRAAGQHMTIEQINTAGKEAEAKFGINKDDFMLILLSGKDEFKDYILNESGRRLKNGKHYKNT